MTRVFNFFQANVGINKHRIFFFLLLFTFHLSLFTFGALAQTDEPADAEAPPLKMFTTAEKNQLETVTDPKKRTELALNLMEARLKKAEEHFTREEFAEMFPQLGGFHALVDDTINFLYRNNYDNRKSHQNFKRVEMALRGFLSRIEIIRRDLPLKYEFYVRGLAKTVRDARTRAVDPLFSNSVVPAAAIETTTTSQN